MKRILLLSEEEAKGILFCAHKGGHEVLVAGNLDRNKLLRHHPMCRKFIPLVNTLEYSGNDDELVDEIINIVKKENIDVLLPSSFDCIRLASRYRKAFEAHCHLMPTPDLETISELDDKNRFYLFCKKHGIAHPASHLIEKQEDINSKEALALSFPLILKPVLGSGEEGLQIFQSRSEMDSFFQNNREKATALLPALIQEMFEGEDIDFNGFAVNGVIKAWSVMRTTFYNGKKPFRLTDYIEYDEVKNLGMEIVKHSNFSGPLNIDMRISKSDGRVYLIEVNPRFWARGPTSLMDGVNYVDVGIRTASDDTYSVTSRKSGKQWVSSLGPLLMSALVYRDKTCWKYLMNLSKEQFEYILFTKYFLFTARLKQKIYS